MAYNDNNSNSSKSNNQTFYIAIGWDTVETSDSPVDLDLSCFLLNEEKSVRSNDDFIFYNQLDTPDGCVQHLGDCLGDETITTNSEESDSILLVQDESKSNDAETIVVHLNLISAEIFEVVFAVTIYEAQKRKHNFGMINSAYIRVVNHLGKELARYELNNAPPESTGLIFGTMQRKNDSWHLQKIKKSFTNGLRELALMYGVELEE